MGWDVTNKNLLSKIEEVKVIAPEDNTYDNMIRINAAIFTLSSVLIKEGFIDSEIYEAILKMLTYADKR